ncbi:hypothetical protein GCM10009801_62060 [Streptomyces albiaxialis]|uniref:Uncharacterized protein n=1 Tax=Streptomyces albiaxialis TaxID=329523 RepID=A0ABN2WK70_9ACTN
MSWRHQEPTTPADAAVSSLVIASAPFAQSAAPGYRVWSRDAHRAVAVADALAELPDPRARTLVAAVTKDPADAGACRELARLLVPRLGDGDPQLGALVRRTETTSRLRMRHGDPRPAGLGAPRARDILRTAGGAARPQGPVEAAFVIPFRERGGEGHRTRNPAAYLHALADQSVPRDSYHVVVVESGSEPAGRASTARAEVAAYRARLAPLPLRFQDPGDGPDGHVYHLFQVRAESEAVRDGLLAHLVESGVDAVVRYPVPPPRQPALSSGARGTERAPAPSQRSWHGRRSASPYGPISTRVNSGSCARRSSGTSDDGGGAGGGTGGRRRRRVRPLSGARPARVRQGALRPRHPARTWPRRRRSQGERGAGRRALPALRPALRRPTRAVRRSGLARRRPLGTRRRARPPPTAASGCWASPAPTRPSCAASRYPPAVRARRSARLTGAGLAVRDLPVLRDVDTPEDAEAVAHEAPGTRFAAELARRTRQLSHEGRPPRARQP